jgi:LPS-assembly lipoprotein
VELPILSLSAERYESRPVTVNPRARAAQYAMQMSVTISLDGPQGTILESDTLSVERLFFENIETISGNLEEMEVIRSEMRRELVDQLLRRLAALADANTNA